ncbi:MAG: chromosomal replication initiator protein [Microgenomates group bacterium Gr01-1014_16]|nr:MAG: chromosomal replication initiator protein [Microgenomates group bacterium Gr01-1014_16]
MAKVYHKNRLLTHCGQLIIKRVSMKKMDTDKIWDGVMAGLKLAVSEATFNTYFRNTRLGEIKEAGDRLVCVVGTGSAMTRDMLDLRYKGQVVGELERVTGKKCEVEWRIESVKAKQYKSVNEGLPLFEEVKQDPEKGRAAGLRDDYTFSSYAVGGSNQMAFAAAQAVARKPGEAYNPLFIYGGVGVGKTHLMQAIGREILERAGGKIVCCTSEQFTNDLVEGIRNKSTEKVRTKYRQVKVLLIDDVQFIAGKVTAQEEFFHTFNAIQGAGGQVVMTSDRPPAEIAKLEARLRSRFGAGLIVDIGQPDFELRTAILLIKAKQKNINLPMEAAQLIAEQVVGVRELEGALVRLQTKNVEIDSNLVRETLKMERSNGSRKILTAAEVILAVSEYFGVGVQLLKGEKRTKSIVWPRQILMFILRKDLRLPQEEVGRLIGGRDHSTVIHATEKVEEAMKLDRQTETIIHNLRQKMLIAG